MTAWRKLAPTAQRLPLPWAVLCAMLGAAVRIFQARDLAAKWLFMHHTYVRPGEADALKVRQLIPPTPAAGPAFSAWGVLLAPTEDAKPGKTGVFDEAIKVDDPRLWPVLLALTAGRPPDERVWTRSLEEELHIFDTVVETLKLAPLRPCRYALRHGGASHDLLHHHRSLPEIKRRGRWRADSSLLRYAKETRLLSELRKIDSSIVELGNQVELLLPGVILGTVPAPAGPPIIVRPGRKRARLLS